MRTICHLHLYCYKLQLTYVVLQWLMYLYVFLRTNNRALTCASNLHTYMMNLHTAF